MSMTKKETPRKTKPFKCKFCKRKQIEVFFYVINTKRKPKIKDAVDVCEGCHDVAIEKGYKKVGFEIK